MPGFDSIIDQERPVRILTTLLHSGTIPHALLFTGIDGVGKIEAAVAMATAINCRMAGGAEVPSDLSAGAGKQQEMPRKGIIKADGCGACTVCRKIQSGNHPDVHWLEPAGAAIKIAQIRELAEQVVLKPYEATCRAIIIAKAHKMNAPAANALLKLLEEPPERTLFILTARQPGDLLPTVASRCQHIRFNPISRKKLEVILSNKYNLPDADARTIAALAGGSVQRATEMVQSNWLDRRNWLINQLMTLSLESVNHLLALAERLASNRDHLQEGLDIMLTWLRDLLIHPYAPGKMLNGDLISLVPRSEERWRPEAIIHKMKAIETARRKIEANANPRLACEALLIEIAR